MSDACVTAGWRLDSPSSSGTTTLRESRFGQSPFLAPARTDIDVDTAVNHEGVFLEHFKLIDSVLATIARRSRLSADEADEFRSVALLKLIDNDYQVLRKCEDASKLRSYLVVVCQRLLLDHRNHLWGKWRPSTLARRGGALAVHLERLLHRDRLTLDEAIEVLRHRYNVVEDRATLARLASALPPRTTRRTEHEEVAADVPDAGPLPDAVAMDHELGRRALAARDSLWRALASLDAETRLLLKLFFWDRLTIAQIARMMAIDQRPLYRRFDAVLKQLRRQLESDPEGAAARDLLESRWSDFTPPMDVETA